MKITPVLLFYFFISSVFSQTINYNDFDEDLFDIVLIREFNNFRRTNGLDTLVYSSSLHNSISEPNCVEVSNSGKFYHPDINVKWSTSGVKNQIARESNLMIGGKILKHSDGTYYMDTWENAFRSTKKFNTYQELAKFAIYSWSQSVEHNKIQMKSFKSSGLPGMFACDTEYVNGVVFVYMNFVSIYRYN